MPIGPTPMVQGIYPQYPNTWVQPTIKKTVTETMEYDEKGNLVKRTVVTEETTQTPAPTTPYITYNSSRISSSTADVDAQVKRVVEEFNKRG